ncbi:MAG: cob(I)yrinic acid a,c-diamide adenosyltransferase [Spirochaetia bacterium]
MKSSITTKRGDDGTTDLLKGGRQEKIHPVFDALGDLDELTAALGLCRLYAVPEENHGILQIQKELSLLSGALAGGTLTFGRGQINRIETELKKLEESVPPVTEFVFPGDNPRSAHFHFARSICRRAERSILKYFRMEQQSTGDIYSVYLNRLSDLLFLMAEKDSPEGHGRSE